MTEPNDNIIKEFLIQPHNRRKFNDFYKFCYNFTNGYLHFLKRINYQLPYDDRTDKDPIEDLAIDILGFFLAHKKDKPFYIIYNYFSQHGINDFQPQSPEILNDMFAVLLKGFIKKQLFKFKHSTNPQIENLKKRFKVIFKESRNFKSIRYNKNEYIYMKSEKENLRKDNPPLPYEDLLDITLKAFYKSNNRTEWCYKIFKYIEEKVIFQNMVSKYQLLTTVVKVNAEYIDNGEFFTHQISSTKSALINSSIKKAFDVSLDNLKTEILSAYLKKQAISIDESELLYIACRNYFTDYCNHGRDTDSIPLYFREMMPLETHERYLKDYKNIFESSIKKMLVFFKNELKNSSTIQRLGNY